MVLVLDKSGLIFGAFNSKDWKTQRNSYFGDQMSFLFEIAPRPEISRAMGPGRNFIFYNSDLTRRGSISGLGFGGELKKPRIWLDSNLQTGVYNGGGSSFWDSLRLFVGGLIALSAIFASNMPDVREAQRARGGVPSTEHHPDRGVGPGWRARDQIPKRPEGLGEQAATPGGKEIRLGC